MKTGEFIATAFRPEIIRRALVTAGIVGTVLALINHGPELLSLQLEGRRLLQIGLTFLVPYCVSTYAATMQELHNKAAGSDSELPASASND